MQMTLISWRPPLLVIWMVMFMMWSSVSQRSTIFLVSSKPTSSTTTSLAWIHTRQKFLTKQGRSTTSSRNTLPSYSKWSTPSSSKTSTSTIHQCRRTTPPPAFRPVALFSTTTPRDDTPPPQPTTTTTKSINDVSSSSSSSSEKEKEEYIPPWNNPNLIEKIKEQEQSSSSNNKNKNFRARQHVNPLARRFQQPTILSPNWPHDMFHNTIINDDDSKQRPPLFLDIGCSRGGFLVKVAKQQKQQQKQQEESSSSSSSSSSNLFNQKQYNYLGLEIRPIVVHQAQERVTKHKLNGILGFVGCNANVDLHRLLTLYHETNNNKNDENKNDNDEKTENQSSLEIVTIQFPDPHFKTQHVKRRVVTTSLVTTLALFMKENSIIFLQSDILPVLIDMKQKFQEQNQYFQMDPIPTISKSITTISTNNDNDGNKNNETNDDDLLDYSAVPNIIGIPTEREISVLERGLPVYRAVFRRTATPVVNLEDDDEEEEN